MNLSNFKVHSTPRWVGDPQWVQKVGFQEPLTLHTLGLFHEETRALFYLCPRPRSHTWTVVVPRCTHRATHSNPTPSPSALTCPGDSVPDGPVQGKGIHWTSSCGHRNMWPFNSRAFLRVSIRQEAISQGSMPVCCHSSPSTGLRPMRRF